MSKDSRRDQWQGLVTRFYKIRSPRKVVLEEDLVSGIEVGEETREVVASKIPRISLKTKKGVIKIDQKAQIKRELPVNGMEEGKWLIEKISNVSIATRLDISPLNAQHPQVRMTIVGSIMRKHT